jgi:Flp pilus assembly protein TadB
MQAEVRALATQARASAGVLAIAPVAFAGLVATVEPRAVAFLVASPLGVACLLLGLGLEGAGAAWMAHITRSVS